VLSPSKMTGWLHSMFVLATLEERALDVPEVLVALRELGLRVDEKEVRLTLAELEASGLVRSLWTRTDDRRSRVYRSTTRGRATLDELEDAWQSVRVLPLGLRRSVPR
jgi:DNA-binding PadR family transcriptional regulator